MMPPQPFINTSNGRRRAFDFRPLRLPRDPAAAAALASQAEAAAVEAYDDGRLAEADKLTHLCIELEARAGGGCRA